jgi:hypothetical protein
MHQMRLTDDQRRALKEAAALLAGQAEGLRGSGSSNTVAAFHEYVATLRTLAAAEGPASISPEQKTHVEKTGHVLEGVRDGLFNADFETRAKKVDETVRRLDEIVTEINTQASQS